MVNTAWRHGLALLPPPNRSVASSLVVLALVTSVSGEARRDEARRAGPGRAGPSWLPPKPKKCYVLLASVSVALALAASVSAVFKQALALVRAAAAFAASTCPTCIKM